MTPLGKRFPIRLRNVFLSPEVLCTASLSHQCLRWGSSCRPRCKSCRLSSSAQSWRLCPRWCYCSTGCFSPWVEVETHKWGIYTPEVKGKKIPAAYYWSEKMVKSRQELTCGFLQQTSLYPSSSGTTSSGRSHCPAEADSKDKYTANHCI